MTLFTLFAVPLSFILLGLLFYPDLVLLPKTWIVFGKGVLFFLPIVVVVLLLPDSDPSYLNPPAFFLYGWIRNTLIYQLGGVGFFLLLFGMDFDAGKKTVTDSSRRSVCFFTLALFSGYYTLTGLLDVIIYYGRYDVYILFLLPAARVALILASSLLLTLMLALFRFLKLPLIIAVIAVTVIPGLITFSHYRNFTLWSIVATVLFLAASFFCFLFFREKVTA